jgi:hypothetical protein
MTFVFLSFGFVSDFGFLLLFVLGVLCVFAARPVEYPFHRSVIFSFARPVEYPFHRSVIFSFAALFHGASPVEYRVDRGL